MIFAIVAAEGIYQGLHGINDKTLVEVSDWKEAIEIAIEMSLEVMDSYSQVYDTLEAEVQEEIDFNDTVNWTDERIEKLRTEIYRSNLYFDIFELDENKIKDIPSEQLEAEFFNDEETFLSEYQKFNN